MQIDSFDTIHFQYNTGQIPPPFCYMYSLEISNVEKNTPQASLNLEYFDREELTEEEIYEEGYSIDDNISWHGVIPAVWMTEIQKKLKSTNWRKKPATSDDGSELIIKIVNENQSELMHPADNRSWEIFTQEIIQAILELSNKEAPLMIRFISKKEKNVDKQLTFEFSFASRSVQIKGSNDNQTSMPGRQVSIKWEEGQKLLKYIFGIDYDPENSMQSIPEKEGNYISPGDNLWYELKGQDRKGRKTPNAERLAEALLKYVK